MCWKFEWECWVYVILKVCNLYNILYEVFCNELCYFSEIVCWDIIYLNLFIFGSVLRILFIICIVMGREVIVVKKLFECCFVI